MSTRRLYYDDSYMQAFDARVTQCVPARPVITDAGTVPAWEVLLDESAFYPTSGGQPNDLGRLGPGTVLDVRDDGDDIVHLVDCELPRGSISGKVDWARRFDHMQQHTGQHLLSAMFEERFGLPTVSFHLGAEFCTIDLRGEQPTTDVLAGAQRAANEVIFEDRPVNVRYDTADQLYAQGVRRRVERPGILRAIEIEGADLQPCGGTHVRSSGQIGMILVRRCTKMRQDWRVEFACGGRAERFASGDCQRLRALADRLSCAPEEVGAAVEKLIAEGDSNFKGLRRTLQQLAEARAASLAASAPIAGDGSRVVAEVLTSSHPDLLPLLATELAKQDQTVALVILAETGQLVFARHPEVMRDLGALLKQVLAAFPGKGGGSHEFVRARLNDPADSPAALELARRLLLE